MTDIKMTEAAQTIADEMNQQSGNAEKNLISMPEDLKIKIQTIAAALDIKATEEKRKKGRLKIIRSAAVFLICFITMGTVAMGTSEAFRRQIFSLFENKEAGSVVLRSQTEQDLIGLWEDYWYPTYLPDGYYMQGAEEKEHLMFFASEKKEAQIRIYESSMNSNIGFDTESTEGKAVRIGRYEGYAFSDVENTNYSVIWKTDDRIIHIYVTGFLEEKTIIKIAENMEYIGE